MVRVRRIDIEGYRSIGDQVTIRFPRGRPVVLVGENNAGKSNIVRAIELVLGERWPGNHAPDDHEFFGRNGSSGSFRITAAVEGVAHWRGQVDSIELACSANGATRFTAVLDDGSEQNMNNSVRGQLGCVVVGTDRNLQYQLSYASQWTLLSKLMQKFHKRLLADEGRAERLRQHFEALHGIFHEVPEFAKFATDLQDEVARLSTNLQYRLDFDFSAYDPSNYFKALRVQPRLGAERRTFQEIGTGQEQILALGFAYAYAAAFGPEGSGLLLVIEEPEAHLHPLAQEWLAAQMRRFLNDGVQVLITTHSPAFIDLCHLDGLVIVRKVGDEPDGGCTYTTQQSAGDLAQFCAQHGAPKADAASILEYYEWSSTTDIKAGFFARAVVLVEGPTEALALPVLLRKLGLETTQAGIAVIPVGGKGALARWWRLFRAFDIPTYVVFDNDRDDDRNGTKREDLLDALAVDDEERTALLGTPDVFVSPRATAFHKDFETTMRALCDDYAALESQAAELFGLSKPLKAKWVADRMEVPQLGALRELAATIGRLVDEAAGSDGAGADAEAYGLAEPEEVRFDDNSEDSPWSSDPDPF